MNRLNKISSALLAAAFATFSHHAPAYAQVQDTTVELSFDEMGRIVAVDRPLNRKTSFMFDKLGRVKRETVAIGASNLITQLQYDGLSQLTGVVDPRNLTTSYTLTGLGAKTAQTSPDTASEAYTHDEDGNLLTSTDARGKTTTYSYDLIGRLAQVAYASGTPVQFEYDGGAGGPSVEIGNLTKVTDQSGSTTFTHDEGRRLLSKVQVVNAGAGQFEARLSYTYGSSGSATGKVTSMTYPSGARVNYSYDANGRIAALTLNPAEGNGATNQLTEVQLLSNIQYTVDGALKSWTWGVGAQGSSYERSFDIDGRLVSYPLDDRGTIRTVSYNAANLITGYTHSGNAQASGFDQTFSYDGADRLVSFTKGGRTTTYTYDANGNRTAQTGPAATFAMSGSSNRLLGVSGAIARSYSYDNAGNRIGDGMFSYTYGDNSRLSKVTGSGMSMDLLYNGKGERVAKLGGMMGAAYFAYDASGKTLGEYVPGTGESTEVVYLGNTPVVAIAPWAQYAIYADHIDTPLALSQGDPVNLPWDWRHRDPFGSVQPITMIGGPAYFNHRFPGQMADQETGLYYNYFRDYDPQTGRYVQSDPIGLAAGINTYSYVLNTPLTQIDPLGLANGSVAASMTTCNCGDILQNAKGKVGDPKYSFASDYGFGADKNKCNLFVDDVTDGMGPRRYGGFGGPITAGEWGRRGHKIPGWVEVTTPKPGDVVAVAAPSANATGHVGIVEIPGQSTISANGEVGVRRAAWPWNNAAASSMAVYRRCTCSR